MDVRDIRGRLVRLVISVIVGIVGTGILVAVLPRRDHFSGFQCCICAGSPVMNETTGLLVAGVVGIAVITNALLGAIRWQRQPKIRLPRATLLR